MGTRRRREVFETDYYVSANVRMRRIMLGITQLEVAELIGVAYQQMHKYETGINRIPVGNLYLIAKALRCEPADFFPDAPASKQSADKEKMAALLSDTASLSREERHVVFDAARRLAAA